MHPLVWQRVAEYNVATCNTVYDSLVSKTTKCQLKLSSFLKFLLTTQE